MPWMSSMLTTWVFHREKLSELSWGMDLVAVFNMVCCNWSLMMFGIWGTSPVALTVNRDKETDRLTEIKNTVTGPTSNPWLIGWIKDKEEQLQDKSWDWTGQFKGSKKEPGIHLCFHRQKNQRLRRRDKGEETEGEGEGVCTKLDQRLRQIQQVVRTSPSEDDEVLRIFKKAIQQGWVAWWMSAGQ